MNSKSQIIEPRHTPFDLLWAFMRGSLLPIVALILSILISLGIGVMAAEDWDGFAQRIDLGKTAAFYISLMFGIWLGVRAAKHRSDKQKTAQALGLAIILLLWLVLL